MPKLPFAVASLAVCAAVVGGCQQTANQLPSTKTVANSGATPPAGGNTASTLTAATSAPRQQVSKEMSDRVLLGMTEMDVNGLMGRAPDAIVSVDKTGNRRRCQWFAPGATVEVEFDFDRTRFEANQPGQANLRRVTGKVFYARDMSGEWYPGMTPAQLRQATFVQQPR